jgi:hypothetical protein
VAKSVNTVLGNLTVFSDQHDFTVLVELLVEVALELDTTLPKALYYGSPDYTTLLKPDDFHDRHLVTRGASGVTEFWHRDQMVLFFGKLDNEPTNLVKALLAHELIHNSDNNEGRYITSYSMPCIYHCYKGFVTACVGCLNTCMGTLRNTSVNSRLPFHYRKVCLSQDLEQAYKLKYEAKKLEEPQKSYSLLYLVILSSALILFEDSKAEAYNILKSVLSTTPSLKSFSLVLKRGFQEVLWRPPNLKLEESFIRTITPEICSTMKHIALAQ